MGFIPQRRTDRPGVSPVRNGPCPGEVTAPCFHPDTFTGEVSQHELIAVQPRATLHNPLIAKVGTAKVGTAKVGTAKVGTAKVGTVKVGTVKVGTAKVGPVKVGTAKVGTAKVGTAKVGTAKVGT